MTREFRAAGGIFTLGDDGILEYWSGGKSFGRFRAGEIRDVATVKEKGDEAVLQIYLEHFQVALRGESGIEVKFDQPSELNELLAALDLHSSGA